MSNKPICGFDNNNSNINNINSNQNTFMNANNNKDIVIVITHNNKKFSSHFINIKVSNIGETRYGVKER